MKDWEPSAIFEQALLAESLAECKRLAEPFKETCESPIELSFIVALRFFAKLMGYQSMRVYEETKVPASAVVEIIPQVTLYQYRVDFLVGYAERAVIVECDGKDFHHATREQIERDRKRDKILSEKGFKVVRFPGTQIHNDPMRCAADVLMYLVTGKFLSE